MDGALAVLISHDFEKSCKGKKTHPDAASVLVECFEVYRQVGQRVVAYPYRHFPHYHTGRNPLIIRRFIEELIGYEPSQERAPIHLTSPLAEAFESAGIST